MKYQIKIERFEGPLDLLLQLIEKEELDITEISMRKVADDYIVHIQALDKINLAYLADFLDIAARLLLLKSRAILPVIEISEDEEEDIQSLEDRLREYKRYKELAEDIKGLAEGKTRLFARPNVTKPKIESFVPPEDVNVDNLWDLLQKVLEKIPEEPVLPQGIIEKQISIEEKIEEIKRTIAERNRLALKHFLEKSSHKLEVIVTFLAILELLKQRILIIQQERTFGEITLIAV